MKTLLLSLLLLSTPAFAACPDWAFSPQPETCNPPPQSVPEPGSMALVGLGMGMLLVVRRRVRS